MMVHKFWKLLFLSFIKRTTYDWLLTTMLDDLELTDVVYLHTIFMSPIFFSWIIYFQHVSPFYSKLNTRDEILTTLNLNNFPDDQALTSYDTFHISNNHYR